LKNFAVSSQVLANVIRHEKEAKVINCNK
jgi:hypothetical protein